MKIAQAIVSEILYRAIKSFIFVVRITPRPVAITTGRILGLVFWTVVPYYRNMVRIQMKTALGHGYSWKLPLKVFMNVGMIPVDIIKFSYLDEAGIRERMIVEGQDNLSAALDSGRPIMVINGHISNWEILANIPIFMGRKLHIVMAVQRDPKLESIVSDIRDRLHGVEVLPATGGMLTTLIDALKQGKDVGMMVDQRHLGRYGLICDVLGLPAVSTPAPAFIALKADAIILPVYNTKDRGKTYRVHFEKPIDPRDYGPLDSHTVKLREASRTEPVQKLSNTIQSWLTGVIRAHPDQWLWLHSRWVRKKNMKKIFREGLDFREYVFKQAEELEQRFDS